MSKITTLEIGGPAKYFLIAKSKNQLINVIKLAQKQSLSFLVIGDGSNLLVSDKGVNALVIKNEITGIKQDGNQLTVQGGTNLQDLVNYTIKHDLAGIQKLTGIPGTVAGAIYGNAGAYGQTISNYLTKIVCFDCQKEIILTKRECQFEYRDSIFKKNGFIILEVTFKLPKGNHKRLKKDADETLALRLQKYKPGLKCPGSFFKNVFENQVPKETLKRLPVVKDFYGKVPAWLFLQEVGAKGDKLGQIEIANFHANLFINKGGGKAAHFYKLASKYHKKVLQKFKVNLEPEVQLINLPPLN